MSGMSTFASNIVGDLKDSTTNLSSKKVDLAESTDMSYIRRLLVVDTLSRILCYNPVLFAFYDN